jgi:hypothetical protein
MMARFNLPRSGLLEPNTPADRVPRRLSYMISGASRRLSGCEMQGHGWATRRKAPPIPSMELQNRRLTRTLRFATVRLDGEPAAHLAARYLLE